MSSNDDASLDPTGSTSNSAAASSSSFAGSYELTEPKGNKSDWVNSYLSLREIEAVKDVIEGRNGPKPTYVEIKIHPGSPTSKVHVRGNDSSSYPSLRDGRYCDVSERSATVHTNLDIPTGLGAFTMLSDQIVVIDFYWNLCYRPPPPCYTCKAGPKHDVFVLTSALRKKRRSMKG